MKTQSKIRERSGNLRERMKNEQNENSCQSANGNSLCKYIFLELKKLPVFASTQTLNSYFYFYINDELVGYRTKSVLS